MAKEFSGVQALLRAVQLDVQHATKSAQLVLHEVGEEIKSQAQAKIGLYNPASGPFPGWAPLADSTKNQRSASGFADNEPLLRDGTLRDAITFDVHANHVLVGVKSSLSSGKTDIGDIAVWQEYGTGHIPPRPFLGPALFENRKHIGKLISEHIASVLRRKL